MTNDEIDRTLQRIFPGDPVPEVSEDTDWSDEPNEPVSWRISAPPTKVRHVESPRVKAPPRVREDFARVVNRLPPVVPAPSVPSRAFLLESPENVTRWLDEAAECESDAKLGQPVEPHRATRLLLEAIPAVRKLKV